MNELQQQDIVARAARVGFEAEVYEDAVHLIRTPLVYGVSLATVESFVQALEAAYAQGINDASGVEDLVVPVPLDEVRARREQEGL